jgi:hypothetical protein
LRVKEKLLKDLPGMALKAVKSSAKNYKTPAAIFGYKK